MRHVGLAGLVCALALLALARDKKKEETQTLEIPKDPPNTVVAPTARLVFHVSPLLSKGLFSHQVRESMKYLVREAGRAQIVKIRAFVAGSGDLRRVRDVLSDTFTDRKQPLPALTVVQVGALPLEGAQVVLESTAVERKNVNEYGLALISGQGASSEQPLDPIVPLARKALSDVGAAVQAAGSEPQDVLRVTCFLSALDAFQNVRDMFATRYPQAALNFVQLQRSPSHAVAECEAVARLRRKTGTRLDLLNPDGLAKSPNFSQIALVGAPEVILSSSQASFGFQDGDVRLAFQRLEESLKEAGGSLRETAFASLYPLSASISQQVRRIRFDFYDKSRPPASTLLEFQGLPSIDSGFAIDVVAVKN